ncbi:MAG: acyltransferase [Firmicutes bacterium]|nr:acyltransferase [Bacillota bacterium]
MRVGIYQFAPEFGDIESNLNKAEAALSQLEADLMVLPELFSTGYLFESREELKRLAEEIPGGRTTRALEAIARKKGMGIVAGMAEYDPQQDKYFNSAVVLGPSGYLGKYRKIHLFYKEKKWFAPGDLGYQVFEIKGAKVGVMICFDWFFPEAARVLALSGAQVVCQPANLVLPWCQQAMITRSLENNIICVTANRVGREVRDEEDLGFTGQSQVVDVGGVLRFRLGDQDEASAVIEVDPARAIDKSINVHNQLFNDRRPEWYQNIIKS